MRSIGLVTALVVFAALACVGAAVAQNNAATLGRGGTGTAITNEDATGWVNPAGLAQIDVNAQPSDPEDKWVGQIGWSQDLMAEADYWALQGAARRRDANYGWGVGYSEAYGNDKIFYLSYGRKFGKSKTEGGWSWGLGIMHENWKTWEEIDDDYPELGQYSLRRNINEVFVDGGLMYVADTDFLGADKWSFGATVWDILSKYHSDFNAGVAMDWGKFRLMADYFDFTDDDDDYFCFGGEFKPCKMFTVRAGSLDGDLTLGGSISYGRLALDYGWIDYDDDDNVILTQEGSSSGPDDYDGLTLRYVYSW